MPQSHHERKRVVIEPYPLESRETILARLEACKACIHSPYSWYREDVRNLLIRLDMQHTELQELKSQLEESGV